MDVAMVVSIVSAAVTVSALPFVIWQAKTASASAHEARRQTEAATRQTELQEEMHEASQQPYVWVDVAADTEQASLLLVTVCNEGPTVATDIIASFDPALESTYKNDRVEKVQQDLKSGIASLAPGRRIRWVLDAGPGIFNEDTVKQTDIALRYYGPYGEIVNRYRINIEDIRYSLNVPSGSFHQLGERVKELTRAVKELKTNG